MKTRIKCAICGHTFDFSKELQERRDTPVMRAADYDSKYETYRTTCPSCKGTLKVTVGEI
jgi:C4-type Zn-finger protein